MISYAISQSTSSSTTLRHSSINIRFQPLGGGHGTPQEARVERANPAAGVMLASLSSGEIALGCQSMHGLLADTDKDPFAANAAKAGRRYQHASTPFKVTISHYPEPPIDSDLRAVASASNITLLDTYIPAFILFGAIYWPRPAPCCLPSPSGRRSGNSQPARACL